MHVQAGVTAGSFHARADLKTHVHIESQSVFMGYQVSFESSTRSQIRFFFHYIQNMDHITALCWDEHVIMLAL